MDAKSMFETWERAATAWSDAWMRSPAFLQAVGKTLEAQLGIKAGANRLTDDILEAWRIPTARDLTALGERIASLEERLEHVEAGASGGAGQTAAAGKGSGTGANAAGAGKP